VSKRSDPPGATTSRTVQNLRTIEPITTEVIQNGLIAAANEMKITLEKTAYSTIIYEILDYSVGIFDTKPNMIAQVAGLPGFLGNLTAAIAGVIEDLGLEAMHPGDIILMNDPYVTGTHKSDTTTIMPVFFGGEVVAFTASRAHWLDIGGKVPGGWCLDTVDVFQEGLRFFAVKAYDRGNPTEVIKIVKYNVRVPDYVLGDLRAQIAACNTGGARFVELLNKYGKETVFQSIGEILDRSEKAVRLEIGKIPPGRYEASAFMDHDGVEKDKPRKINVALTVEKDRIDVDLTGSSEQCVGPTNCGYAGTVGAVRATMKFVLAPSDPVNEGSFRPITITVPRKTMFSAELPAPCDAYGTHLNILADVIIKAFSEALPDLMPASHYGCVAATFVYGTDPRTDKYYIVCDPQGGGFGAGQGKDGENCLIFMMDGDTRNIPIEVAESKYPLMIERYELLRDSGGAGKWRGGLGAVKEYKVLHDNARITVINDRHVSPPWGLYEGKDGATSKIVLWPGTDKERVTEKVSYFGPLNSGESYSLYTGGGGGYGRPFERDPQLVLQDVIEGYVSLEDAKTQYGVIIDAKNKAVDESSTASLRRKD